MRPVPTATVLAAAGLRRGGRTFALGLGCFEVAICVVALSSETVLAALAASALYAAFAIFVSYLLLTGKKTVSCGCFGQEEIPLHPLHAGLNLGLAACSGAAFIADTNLRGVVPPTSVYGVVLLGTAALCAYLVFVAFTVVPSLERHRDAKAGDRLWGSPPKPFVVSQQRSTNRKEASK